MIEGLKKSREKAKKEREKWKKQKQKERRLTFMGSFRSQRQSSPGASACAGHVCGKSDSDPHHHRRLRHGEAANFQSCRWICCRNAMLVAGIVTLVRLYAIDGLVGGKVPTIMGMQFRLHWRIQQCGKGHGRRHCLNGRAIMLASVLGGLFETVLGFY